MTTAAPARRWPIYLPTLALLLGAAVWSAFWWYAAGRAEQAADAFMAREAAKGRVYACGERTVGGYPFRIELRCERPSASVRDGENHLTLEAPRLVAVAQVYDPRRMIVDLTGPVGFMDAQGRRGEAAFRTAQASGTATLDGKLERASAVVADPRLTLDGTEQAAGSRLEAHLRRTPDAGPGAYDVALALDSATSPWLGLLPVGDGPATFELQASLTQAGELRPAPLEERLRAFQAADGRVRIDVARLIRGDVEARIDGDLGLDAQGRLDGRLTLVARGLDEIVRGLAGGAGGRRDDLLSSLLGAGAQMLGKPAKIDDKPATAYDLRLDRGRVELGPIRLYRLPPLY
ncbi:DUF2125 domain-containing protein [Methylopila musalis]|uniref:DUF2125 domain-containing protein n=1 Tax=Methylopila musalis TaxID=1134781 RepID=A0ABW3Z6K9_9HYPH